MSPDIRLEPMGMDHAAGYAALLSDPGTAPYISDQGLLTHEAVLVKLQRISAADTAGVSGVYFAVVHNSTREFVGYVAAHDLLARSCPISYAVLPDHRGRGIARTAIHLLLDYLAQHSTAEWIEARTHLENLASQTVLQACGFNRLAPAGTSAELRLVHRRKNRVGDKP